MSYAIRPSRYRGKAGVTLSGPRVKIFFERREQAERVREKLRSDPNYSTTLADFGAGDTECAAG